MAQRPLVTSRGTIPTASGREARLQGLGATIREARRARGLTTVALAAEVGVSPSLISQIERGLTSPSLDVLWGIARVLEMSMGAFFQQPDGDSSATSTPPSPAVVVRAGARKRIGWPNSVSYDLLSPDLQHKIELVWAEHPPGDEGPKEPFTHVGEEQMVVVRGQIHFWVDGKEFVLDEGDAIAFDSSLPHRVANLSTEPALVIAAITPPSF